MPSSLNFQLFFPDPRWIERDKDFGSNMNFSEFLLAHFIEHDCVDGVHAEFE